MKTNNVNLVFDPSLKPVFSKSPEGAGQFAIKDSRDLFYALIHISEHYAALPLAYHYLESNFQQVNAHCAACFSKHYSSSSVEQLLAKPDFEYSHEDGASLNNVLVQYAPVYFTEMAWFPPISQTVSCQNPLAVELMGMYLRLTKEGQTIAKTRTAYRGYLLSSGIDIPALHTYAFAKQSAVVDEVFDFATVQLAFGQFPRVFFPEILGFTLAYCHSPSLLDLCFSGETKEKPPAFLTLRYQRRKQELPVIKGIIQSYLAEFPIQSDEIWLRIQTGFWLYRLQTAYCCQSIGAKLQTVLSPRQAMHKLLQEIMPHAIGHHGNIRLGSKSIDEWFKEQPVKSENFLATLLHSPLVDKAKPENSKLLKLYEFGGPMFGVLDDNGKAVIKNWLSSEINPSQTPRKKTHLGTLKSRSYPYGLKKIPNELERIKVSFGTQQQSNYLANQPNYSKLTYKELYYYLVNNDIYPDVLPAAKDRVKSVLAKARLFNRLPFRHYSHQAFESHIKSNYQHEVDRYKPLNHKPKLSKASYAWGIEQFAPTILTDGSWLQCVHQLAFHPAHTMGELLEKIYDDEIGNGIIEQNHPYIYQSLLDSLEIKLPPIESKEFIAHPGFISGAFDIPVFLMAIAKFPSTFLPELLGLNMAIELSGLGNQYLRLSQALRYWGINSYIVDIHTSIDNLSTGHSALAMKAIQLYLDDIAANSGTAEVDAHWRRIHTGYCSLQWVSNRFKFSLIWQYFLKKPTAYNSNNKAQ